MLRHAIAAALLAASAGANAQVYKCVEDGRTVMTDRPCHADATPIEVKPAAGTYDPEAGAAASKRLAEQIEADMARQRLQDKADARRAAARAMPEAPDECDRMRADHARAKRLAKDFLHPHNVRRQEEIARELVSRSFHECPPSKRISVFDQ